MSSITSTVITVVAFLVIMWSQFALGGYLIQYATGLSYNWAVILISATVAAYLAFGGLKALLHTDVWQGILMWLGLIVVLIFLFLISPEPHLSVGWGELIGKSRASIATLFTDPTLLTVLVATIAAAFAGPDIWQRISFSADVSSANRSLKYAGFAMLLFIIPLALLSVDIIGRLPSNTLGQVLAGEKEPLSEYLQFVVQTQTWNPMVMSIFALGLLSAWLSTADTAGMVISTTILSELKLQDSIISISRKVRIHRSRLIAMLFAVSGAFFAIYRSDLILDDFQGVIALLSSQGLTIFLVLKGYGSSRTVSAALILGGLFAVFLGYIVPQYNQGYFMLLPILPGLLCLLGKQKAIQNVSTEKSDE